MHYNVVNSYISINGLETYKFKAKYSEKMQLHYVQQYFKRFSIDSMKKMGLYKYIFDISVDYGLD